MQYIKWFKEISNQDVSIAGGKGASLGEMYQYNFPIPPGFIISAQTYKEFLDENNLNYDISKILLNIDLNDNSALQNASEEIQNIIIGAEIPARIRNAIAEAYNNILINTDILNSANPATIKLINTNREIPFVAVRSSATAEDLPTASFAGLQATFLNVKGSENVIKAVQQCWASLFTPRAIYYREKNNFPHDKVLIAVVVQKMVNSDKSGIMFSINPTTNNQNEIVIEAGFGLGDAIVSGSVTPDNYIVEKDSLKIKSIKVNFQEWMLKRDDSLKKNIRRDLTHRGKEQKLTESEIMGLSRLAKKIESHYKKPQDIEFAIEDNKIYIVQSRPITTIDKIQAKQEPDFETSVQPILTGLGASPGVVAGKVKIVHSIEDLSKVEKGDILVARMTKPDYVPAMERASGIVTDEGGLTSHASIVSREMGISCVVGTENATQTLKDNQMITVDGHSGKVYEGEIKIHFDTSKETTEVTKFYETKTKIFMNLGEPEKITEYNNLFFDGIGLMRIEFIITSYIGKHPNYLIERNEQDIYIQKLFEGISHVAKTIFPKPIIVRFSDFKTNEYHNLIGGEKYEPKEENPLIGWRGVSRYISPEFIEAFKLECKAIKRTRDSGLNNVYVMLPFVRNTSEVEKCLNILKEEGLERSNDFKIALMAEVPSLVLLVDQFCKYADFFSIGSNDLTMLILGVDRDSTRLSKLGYFDERDPSVLRAIKHLITVAHKNNVKVSICGQAPSEYPEIVEFLVKNHIDSISVNPDVVNSVRKKVSEVENKMKKEELLEGLNFF